LSYIRYIFTYSHINIKTCFKIFHDDLVMLSYSGNVENAVRNIILTICKINVKNVNKTFLKMTDVKYAPFCTGRSPAFFQSVYIRFKMKLFVIKH